MQATVKTSVTFSGIGLHTGRPVTVSVHPASAEHGIWFRRTDVDGKDAMVPAIWHAVEPSKLCTRIINEVGVSVSTIEHLMAALSGCGVRNALIDIDGPEVPILDGSAAPFVRGIVSKGVIDQAEPMRAIEILDVVDVRDGVSSARLEPGKGFAMDFGIDFAEEAIGQQRKALDLANGAVVYELSDSRTFCLQSDVDAMRASGLALGGTLTNAVVFDGRKVLSPGGLRHGDEPVRHKMLDAVGDLALAGSPIVGRYIGYRAGHALTNRLLREMFSHPESYRFVDCDPVMAASLPGAGVTQKDIVALH